MKFWINRKAAIMNSYCRKTEDLSAYLDGELGARARLKLESHLAGCSDCQTMMTDLQRLRTCFHGLPQEEIGIDLVAALPRQRVRRPSPMGLPRFSWWQLLPVSFTAAATLSLGVFLGTSLLGGHDSEVAAPKLAMFDPIPPGSVCIGFFAGCYPQEEI